MYRTKANPLESPVLHTIKITQETHTIKITAQFTKPKIKHGERERPSVSGDENVDDLAVLVEEGEEIVCGGTYEKQGESEKQSKGKCREVKGIKG